MGKLLTTKVCFKVFFPICWKIHHDDVEGDSMKQILRLSFKDTFRSRNSALLAFGILFSFLVPIVIFTVSNSFMNGALEKSFQVYGYFDDILYHAEKQAGGLQNTRNDIKEAIPTEASNR